MLPSRLICRLMPAPLAVVISVAFIVLPRSWAGPDGSRHHVVVRWFSDLLYDGAERMDCLHAEVEEPELSGEELAPASPGLMR